MFVMRLQSKYLQSTYAVVTDLWFNDARQFVAWLGNKNVSFASALGSGEVPSEWTSLGGIMFTLLILFSVVYLLHDTFAKAREYYLDHITDPAFWRSAMNITYSENTVALIRSQAFVGGVFPKHVHLAVIILGIVLSCSVIGFGTIGIATLLYAILQLGILPALTEHGAISGSQDRPSFFPRLGRWLLPARSEGRAAATEVSHAPAHPKAPAERKASRAPAVTQALANLGAADRQYQSPEYWLHRVEDERRLPPANDPLVLISFASEDQDWIDLLRAFLDPQLEQLRNPDGRSYQLWNFSDAKRGTTPGDEFPEVVAEKMWSCRVALVLLSKHYFRSDYCRQIELPFLMWRREHHSLLCVPAQAGRSRSKGCVCRIQASDAAGFARRHH